MKNNKNELSASNKYNEDYYERGLITGVSGYINFSWMPELTIRMAHFLIANLKITSNDKVLDFGCAKGYLVKALRLLDIPAYGVDVSEYAISQVDSAVKEYCHQISGPEDLFKGGKKYDWLISKDVFEHISEHELRAILEFSKKFISNMFVVVPLAADDISGKYIVPEYDRDVTHIIAKSREWWSGLFKEMGWSVREFHYNFKGCKENWTGQFPDGNGFFILLNNDFK